MNVTVMVQPNITDTATVYKLNKQLSKQQRHYDYYWVDTTHDIIMPELFDKKTTAIKWFIRTCIENNIPYTFVYSQDNI